MKVRDRRRPMAGIALREQPQRLAVMSFSVDPYDRAVCFSVIPMMSAIDVASDDVLLERMLVGFASTDAMSHRGTARSRMVMLRELLAEPYCTPAALIDAAVFDDEDQDANSADREALLLAVRDAEGLSRPRQIAQLLCAIAANDTIRLRLTAQMDLYIYPCLLHLPPLFVIRTKSLQMETRHEDTPASEFVVGVDAEADEQVLLPAFLAETGLLADLRPLLDGLCAALAALPIPVPDETRTFVCEPLVAAIDAGNDNADFKYTAIRRCLIRFVCSLRPVFADEGTYLPLVEVNGRSFYFDVGAHSSSSDDDQ